MFYDHLSAHSLLANLGRLGTLERELVCPAMFALFDNSLNKIIFCTYTVFSMFLNSIKA